jgi:hypothetical protein
MRIPTLCFLIGLAHSTDHLIAEDIEPIGKSILKSGEKHNLRDIMIRHAQKIPLRSPFTSIRSEPSLVMPHLRGGSVYSPWMTCSNMEERRRGDGTFLTDHEYSLESSRGNKLDVPEPAPGFWSTDIHAVEQVYGKAYCYNSFRTTDCYTGSLSKEALEEGLSNVDLTAFHDDSLGTIANG